MTQKEEAPREEPPSITSKVLNTGYSWRCECGKWNTWDNETCWKCGGFRDMEAGK